MLIALAKELPGSALEFTANQRLQALRHTDPLKFDKPLPKPAEPTGTTPEGTIEMPKPAEGAGDEGAVKDEKPAETTPAADGPQSEGTGVADPDE
jgi:hypothetical protein